MIKTIITRKTDDVVTNIVENNTEIVINGLSVKDDSGSYIISRIAEDYNVFKDIETSDTIIPQKYKYTQNEGFVVDPTYKPFIPTEKQMEIMQNSLVEMQNAINTLMGV